MLRVCFAEVQANPSRGTLMAWGIERTHFWSRRVPGAVMATADGAAGTAADQALDALYTTAPDDFVTRREELANDAKAAGRTDDSRRIRTSRKPTLAAWAVNLLLHTRPEESRQLLELGEVLREAHRTLDRDELKALSGQQWRVIAALARETAELAATAGHRLTGGVQHDVESTLRAVLADQDAADQWPSGHLASTLAPPSSLPAADALAEGPQPSTAPSHARPAARGDELDKRRRQRERADSGRQDLQSGDRHLEQAREAKTSAGRALTDARDREQHAQQAVTTAEQKRAAAQAALTRARNEVQETEAAREAAGEEVTRAERARRDAARAVKRLGR